MARALSIEDGMTRGSETIRFAPDSPNLVVVPGENGRFSDYTLADVADLIAGPLSIPDNGQLQPGKVRPIGDGKFALFIGNRRRFAMEHLNLTSGLKPGDPGYFWFEAKIEKIDVQAAFLRNVAENYARKNLTLLDIAYDIQKFQSFGMPDKQICEIFATNGKPKSSAWLSQVTKLLTLEPKHRKRLVNGNSAFESAEIPMSESAAIALADVKEDDRDGVLAQIVADRKHEAARQTAIEVLEAEQEADQTGTENPTEETPATGKKAKGRKRAPEAPISEREVRNATRNITGGKSGGSRKMKDLTSFFQEGIDDTTATEGAQQMSEKFLAFCKGELSEKTLRKYWDALVKPKAVSLGK